MEAGWDLLNLFYTEHKYLISVYFVDRISEAMQSKEAHVGKGKHEHQTL